ncbi:MAG: tRNA (adenine-N1)-methyltransferase [Thermoplasmata archaeon]|nr:methyltransferase domain-containing protein [Thermoplasmata archaeon]
MTDVWREGDVAVLKRAGAPPLVLRVLPGAQPVGVDGVIDLSGQIGQEPGGQIVWLGTGHRLLRPSLSDLFSTLRRGAQIVTPKDAAYLTYLAGVTPGAHVAEAGSGSGALTIALATAVGPDGRVTSYERRGDFLDAARQNVRRAGLESRVTFRERDVAQDGLDVKGVSSVLLDLPEPWSVLASAREALAFGGSVATYTPTYNQLERTVRTLRTLGYDEVRSLELFERAIHVGEGGTRPEFDMLGHTGFLASGRKVD